MKYLIVAFCALFILISSAVSQASDGILEGAKIGGGILWNDKVKSPASATGGMFHVATDLKVHDYVDFTPFYDFSRRNSTNTTIAGGELHFHLPFANEAFYFGPGLGVASAGGTTKVQVSGTAGAEFAVTPQFGVFAETKYVRASHDVLNGLSAYSGLSFHMKRE
jgi:hypothetical protein